MKPHFEVQDSLDGKTCEVSVQLNQMKYLPEWLELALEKRNLHKWIKGKFMNYRFWSTSWDEIIKEFYAKIESEKNKTTTQGR